MKLDKEIVQRRIDVMEEVGISFVLNTEVGTDISAEDLQERYDRVIIASGASVPRDLKIKGRELHGIRFAVDYLTDCTKDVLQHGKKVVDQKLAGKHVIVVGGVIQGTTVSVQLYAKVRLQSSNWRLRRNCRQLVLRTIRGRSIQ